MAQASVVEQLRQKGADIDGIVEQVIARPEPIAELIKAVQTEKGTAKYAYEKVLRLVSEREPELVYPWFDVFVALLDCDNSFLKWGVIMTVANLVAADTENKFKPIFQRYYAPIKGPVMVTAANIIGSSAKIARARPELAQRIAREILKVEQATYERHGVPSPECRNVVIGQAIDALDQLFDQIDDQAAIIKFVRRQLKNTRKPVVKKAEKFLGKHVT